MLFRFLTKQDFENKSNICNFEKQEQNFIIKGFYLKNLETSQKQRSD